MLDDLRTRIANHPAVRHPLFTHLATNPWDTAGWRYFGAQHHHVVKAFPDYLKSFLERLDSELRDDLAVVLDDELREDAVHTELQGRLVQDLGGKLDDPPLPEVENHINWHRAVARDGPIPFVLGTLGLGHEYAIPLIFRQLISGAPPQATPSYLYTHLTQDPQHTAQFEAVIAKRYSDRLDDIDQGAMASLGYRATMWTAIYAAIQAGKHI